MMDYMGDYCSMEGKIISENWVSETIGQKIFRKRKTKTWIDVIPFFEFGGRKDEKREGKLGVKC